MADSYKRAKAAIMEMFSDDMFSKDECIDNLQGLRDEIDILLESLEA